MHVCSKDAQICSARVACLVCALCTKCTMLMTLLVQPNVPDISPLLPLQTRAQVSPLFLFVLEHPPHPYKGARLTRPPLSRAEETSARILLQSFITSHGDSLHRHVSSRGPGYFVVRQLCRAAS